MATFTILTGKALTSAIKGFGATVATFSAKTHQLAYSALAHVEEHHCASHLNALFAVTPLNYRAAIRIWATDLGKVTFTAEPEEAGQFFTYAKASKSDLPAALATGPVEYVRATKDGAEKAFDEIKVLESALKKLKDGKATSSTIAAIEGALRLLKSNTAPKPVAKVKAKATPTLAVDNTPAAEIAPEAEKIAA